MDKQTKKHTLQGFHVLLRHMESPITSVRVAVNAGSHDDVTFGEAHFLEHMFFKGTQLHSCKDMNQKIAAIGQTNAHTSWLKTVFYINTTGRNVGTALELLCEMLFQPNLDQGEFEKERGVILEEWRAGQDDPVQTFSTESCKLVLGHKLAHDGTGTEETIQSMTLDDIKAFRDRHYTRANIAFILVGDLSSFNLDDLDDLLTRHSKHVVDDKVSVPSYALIQPPVFGSWNQPLRFDFQHKTEQVWMGLWMPGLTAKETRYDVSYADDVLVDMIGGGMHSLLFDRLRESLALCYTTGMWSSHFHNVAVTSAYVALEKSNVQRALEEIQSIIEGASVADNLTGNLLSTCREHSIFSLAEMVQTPSGWARVFADDIFDSIAELGIPAISFGEYEYALRVDVDILRARVREVAKRLLAGVTITVMNVR